MKSIENEFELGVGDGLVYFDDFSFMYMFLEFKDMKKATKKAIK